MTAAGVSGLRPSFERSATMVSIFSQPMRTMTVPSPVAIGLASPPEAPVPVAMVTEEAAPRWVTGMPA